MKTDKKNKLRQKLNGYDMDLEKTKNISKTCKFSIFKNLYTENRKFENLGNFSFTSNTGSCCNSRIKNDIKNELRQKPAS